MRCDLVQPWQRAFSPRSLATAPFDGGNLTAILVAVAHKDPAPLKELCSGVDADLADLIMRLLQKDPGQRPQSATEVADTRSAKSSRT